MDATTPTPSPHRWIQAKSMRGLLISSRRKTVLARSLFAALTGPLGPRPRYPSRCEWRILRTIRVASKRLNSTSPDKSEVTLSTIHRVKGRESPHVVVHDASEGLMPHRLSSDTEEERRVFHVAITRASESGVAISAGRAASPFIAAVRTPRPPEPEPQAPVSPITEDTGPTDTKPSPAQAQRRTPVDPPEASTLGEARLREQLKTWRSATAKDAGVPAYVMFNDATLYQIAALRPQSDDDLLSISGMGPVKLQRYGDHIRAIVNGIDES